ncbi:MULTISPECIES: hypothetical protein [Acinetobacter]|uniref:Uncharacterized protein n=1 Tax=Acinetobacter chengduensis TaxID=2420890 RepID=A0ABX9TY37_9GAMM|nr:MULTISPECIES: hypothetical protein [Acinetobacter]MBI1453557.1 hypothetical protein [Acinetobacter sp. FL51]RKG38002.1 hypothetical protein D7V31_15805 [Acinetobacter sp. WCHAc060007]RLL23208.1 hypothetical protein D9K81_05505 [Acinetobacter chengduensis]
MHTILWDEESVFPDEIQSFKKFLKKYLTSLNSTELLQNKPFNYDSENDEFLNPDIQEYYELWLMA